MIDLRKCKKGDRLISSHGEELIYVGPLPESHYYDHEVEYVDPLKGNGSRTHDGFVFRNNRIPETDHDIVKIIHNG